MFAADPEDRQEIGHSKKLPDPFTQIDEFQIASGCPGRNVETNHGAEAHAIHVGEIRQVQYDALGVRNQLHDPYIEKISYSSHQFAAASHCGGAAGAVNLKR